MIHTRASHLANQLWLAIEQPSPDPGPFAEIWDKLGGVVIWGATIGGLTALVWAGVMLGWEKLDPSREQKSGSAILWTVVGGIVAAGGAQIVNWTYGT